MPGKKGASIGPRTRAIKRSPKSLAKGTNRSLTGRSKGKQATSRGKPGLVSADGLTTSPGNKTRGKSAGKSQGAARKAVAKTKGKPFSSGAKVRVGTDLSKRRS